ncbi:NosD domain-containing protein [Bacillus solimangrovi]|uniref:Right handed beta helix domain-containing protein n=1 Tax=Bacillus solimangrovi TaxID=1305675 RepID=A0A1E5LI75_9BACI|nr:right-handed parallel beta-helix repeat-containing protein [Bacillus solimangrovi]OEH93780.1 hypothetical protein BFG57_11395 [Bacillus solimangrovi]
MTIHVVPTEFATVQAAIDAAVAGDSIQILAGTFDGFNVNKERLKVFGCGIGKTVIAGAPAMGGDDGIVVSANQTILKGLTVQGYQGGSGLDLISIQNVLLNIEAKFNEQGIDFDQDNNFTINCIGSFNEFDGFNVTSSNNSIIKCSSFQNMRDGFFVGDPNNTFINNISTDNVSDGFQIGDPMTTLFGNKALKNMNNGIELDESNNNIIGNLVCNNVNDGIEVESNNIQNVIDSNIVRNNGNDDTTAGIFVENGAMENAIRFNKLKNNIVVDINAQGGIGTNIYDGNKCENSVPPGLCT